MERSPADIEVDFIFISDEKAEYVEQVHGVTTADIWSIFSLAPRYFVDDRGRYSMVGPSENRRYLLVGLLPTDEVGTWRLITAYWLRPARGRRLYGA